MEGARLRKKVVLIKPINRLEDYTPRQSQIIELAALGKTDGEIAKILSISPRTARFHVELLKKRLNVATRTQAAVEYTKMKVHAEYEARPKEEVRPIPSSGLLY